MQAPANSNFGVLWDLDGTLIDSEPLHEQTLVHSLAIEGIHAPDDLHELVVGRSATSIHDHFRIHYGLRMPFDAWSDLRSRTYLEWAHLLSPRRDALEAFWEVHARGALQAVVSNSDRAIVDANLKAIGLASFANRSVSRNDVRHGKPDPEPYLVAAKMLGLQDSRITVVEDSAIGALAGIAAGFRTLFWPEVPTDPPRGAEFVEDGRVLLTLLLSSSAD